MKYTDEDTARMRVIEREITCERLLLDREIEDSLELFPGKIRDAQKILLPEFHVDSFLQYVSGEIFVLNDLFKFIPDSLLGYVEFHYPGIGQSEKDLIE